MTESRDGRLGSRHGAASPLRTAAARRLPLLVALAAALAPAVAPAQHGMLRGDVDGDGRITEADARQVTDFVAGRPAAPGIVPFPRGDADGNGRLTALDAAIIRGFAAGRDLSRYPVGRPMPDPAERLLAVRCEGNLAKRTVACGSPLPSGRGPDGVVGAARYLALTTGSATIAADTLMFGVSLQNLIPQPLGVDSLGQVDPRGIRLFFAQAPASTGGVLEVANPDGVATYTGAGQPYFEYHGTSAGGAALDPGERSASRVWKLRFTGPVQEFSFVVHLAAAVRYPRGWLEPEAGDLQTDTVGRAVPVPPAVRRLDAFGDPVAGVAVVFTPAADGQVADSVALTDSLGVARPGAWVLRTRAGVDSLIARAPGVPDAVLTARALPDRPAFLVKTAGDGQWGPARRPLALEPRVTVSDRHGNPTPGIPVSFRVTRGEGRVARGTAATDSAGTASPGGWTLGPRLGENGLTAAAPGVPEAGFTASVRPNVLLVVADDLNDWVGPLGGYAGVQTPSLDRLARQGVTFERAYAPSPLCNPSRSAFLTGVRPSTSGIYGNGGTHTIRLRLPGVVTLPEFLRQGGYFAQGIGKVFHSPTAVSEDSARWSRYIAPAWPEDPRPPVEDRVNFLRWAPLDVPDAAMSDHRVVTQALQFLEEEHEAPFFLAAGLLRPHHAWHVPRPYFDRYPLESIRVPQVPAGDLDDVPPAGVALADPDGPTGHARSLAGRPWQEAVQAYLASITFMDAQLGRLLDGLEASPYRDNTIIIFVGDNGHHLGEKRHWHKSTLWERSERVPFLIAVPGLTPAGARSTRPVDLMSIFPTLAELAGLPLQVPQRVEGVSIRPLLADPGGAWSTPALGTFQPGNHSVHADRWHYIRYADGAEELYDLGQDPNEWRNLASDPGLAGIIAGLRAWLPAEP